MNFTKQVADKMRNEVAVNTENLKIGDTIKFIGLGVMAQCFPAELAVVEKINKKSITLIGGEKIKKNQIVG